MTWYLYCSFQPEITDHFLFFFSRAKKVIHEMPPSHFVDLRLVKTNLDKEGLKFQLEEHAVARILEVWGLLGSHYHCESRHCLSNNMRWIKKSVFNLKCTSVLHVFKLSPDYEELWKKRIKSLPLLLVACRKCIKSASQLSGPKFFSYTDLWWLHNFDFNFINHSNLEDMRIGAKKKF